MNTSFCHGRGRDEVRGRKAKQRGHKPAAKAEAMRVAVIVAAALACILPAGEAFGVAPPVLLRRAGQAASPLWPGLRRARPAVQVQFRDAPDENAVRSGAGP